VVRPVKILFLTQVLPYPPDSGGKIKAFNLIKYLSQKHQVFLASFIRSPNEQRYVAALDPFCADISTILLKRSRVRDGLSWLRSLANGIPFLVLRDDSAAMRQLVGKLAREAGFDVVHAVQLNMAQYALEVEDVPKVLDQENAVALLVERLWQLERPGLRRLLAYMEWRKLRRYEGEMCRRFDYVLTVSQEDKEALQAISNGRGHFHVIPIGVDCEEIQLTARQPDSKNILHVGTMFWPPNSNGVLWFAREVFPLVQSQVPDARFYIVGKNPPKEVRRLQSSYQPSAISHQPIVVTGYIADPTSFIADCAVFIVPLRAGGGMRVKILDAWAQRIPVVSTTIGCEGIEVRPGENILVADTPLDFAQAVVRVIQDGDLAQRLAENGRQWVKEKYDWRMVYRKLDEVYANLAK